MDISLIARNYIKELAKNGDLYEKFINKDDLVSFTSPVSIFMAGSPGAGKTETSKYLIDTIKKYLLEKNGVYYPIIRVDADEIREICPHYNGSNSYLYQRAVSLGVDKLIDYINKKRLNALIDGTFSSTRSISNIEIALRKKREVYIYYIYQEPLRAWEFTLKRERLEQRKITKESFVNAFIKARENVHYVKNLYSDRVILNIIIKNYANNIEKVYINVQNIDTYVGREYNEETLYRILNDVNI
jgi:adenylate kinase family enzyme